MANLSDQKTLQNKSAVMGPTTVHLDTISDLDPAVFEGTFAYSSDKKMYFSNGSTWRTTEDPVIKTPSASSPTADTTTQRQLTLSQYTNSLSSAPYKQIGIVIEVSLSSNMRNLILQKTIDTTVKNSAGIITDWPKTNKYNLLATDTLPNLKPGDVFYWRGKYLATEGQESGFSKPFAQTFPDYIDAPKPISGMNETTNIISVSAYHSPFDIENLYPPYQIQWMLSRNADFSGSFTIKTDIASSNPLDTITLFSTADNTYYWKARYFSTPASGNKNSEYSIPAQSKQVRDISTPKVVPVLGASGKVAQLKITPYNSLTNKSLLETEWLIATSSTNLDKDTGTRYTTTNDTLDIVSLPKISVLDNSQTIYYWKARYKNTITSSEWSPGSTFIRYPEIVAPTVITALGAETKTFVISPFSSEYSTIYPYELTEWLVYDVYDKLVYSETSPSNNSLDIFIHKNVILPDGKYTWSVRYKNTRGTYTTSISSTNYQIPLINKPIPVTVANGTLNQDTLVASPFTSEFGLSPSKSEITILDLNNKTVEVIPFIPDSVETLNVFNRLRGYSILLEAGKNYYWKVKYIGVDSLDVIHESKYSELSTFTQPLYIKTPYITLPAATDPTNQYEGPTITFTSSDFSVEQTFNNKKDNHRYSDWQLASTLDAFVQADRGNYEFITDKVVKSSTVLTTWTTKVLNTGTTYYVRVRHYGDYGYSNWSTPVRFSTLYQYKHFVTLPANYNPNPTIGQGYLGGFYAGNMWQNLTSSNTRIYLNTISVGQTVDFDVPSMQSINNRIVYLGQVLQIRATNYPTDIVITGTVTVASGTVLKISVTNIKKPSTYSVNGSTNYWSVMAKFQIIVSPKSSGYIPDTDRIILRDNSVVDYEYLKPKTTSNAFNQNYAWRNFELSNVDRTVLSEPNDQYLYDVTNTSELLDWPQEFFNLSDGQAIQTAMWRFSWLYYAWISYAANKAYPNSQFTVDSILKPNRPELVFPLAHYVYNLNKNTGINSYRDWYVPSRDELQLCFTNLISTEYSATPAYSTKFAAYRYNPANYSNPSGTSSNFRIDSYISINGNISDAYVTPLDLGLTAPDKVNTHGNNNNSEPYQKPYFYYVSTTLNGRKVDPYLAETTEIGDQYYFPKSNNIYFAQNGTETLTNGTSNRSNAHLLSATCLKTNETSANEYNDSSYNRATLTSNSYIHPVYRIYVNQDIYSYGLFSITYSYNNNISTRLIRRQLA